MSAPAPYITASDLRSALSPATFMAIFDDEQCGSIVEVDASTAVALVLARAHSRVISWLGSNYSRIPLVTDTDVPALLKDAELNYAIGMSFDRHPEYVRAYGCDPQRKSAWDMGELTMQRVQAAVLRFEDATPAASPRNVGGIVWESGPRTLIDSLDGTYNGGDF